VKPVRARVRLLYLIVVHYPEAVLRRQHGLYAGEVVMIDAQLAGAIRTGEDHRSVIDIRS
jgi:hypothetical protein